MLRFHAFNPTLVWFQHTIKTVLTKISPYFQSYLSLISTQKQKRRKDGLKKAFNPTLVWFQRNRDLLLWRWQSTFNPTLVWFQRKSNGGIISTDLTFNPTLVWFQLGTYEVVWCIINHSFQSYLSLISTEKEWKDSQQHLIFQSYLSLISTQ